MEELVDGLGPDSRPLRRGAAWRGRPRRSGGRGPPAGRRSAADVAVVAAPLDVEAGGGELAVAAAGVEQDLVAGLSRHHRRHVDRQAGALEELGAVIFLDGAFLALLLMELEEEAPAVAGLDLAVERIEAAPVGGDRDAGDGKAEGVGDETRDDRFSLGLPALGDQPARQRRRRDLLFPSGHGVPGPAPSGIVIYLSIQFASAPSNTGLAIKAPSSPGREVHTSAQEQESLRRPVRTAAPLGSSPRAGSVVRCRYGTSFVEVRVHRYRTRFRVSSAPFHAALRPERHCFCIRRVAR